MSETPRSYVPRKHKGRHAMFVGVAPEDFHPATPIDLPDRLASLEVIESPLTMCQAIALTRHFNRSQIRNGLADRRWALFVFRPKKGGAL